MPEAGLSDPEADPATHHSVSDETGHRRFSATTLRRMDPAHVAVIVCLLAVGGFIVVRLGPALLGWKTFGPADMLAPRAPWWNGGPVPKVVNDNIGDPTDVLLPDYIQLHSRFFSGDLPWWSSLSGPGSALLAQASVPTLTPSAIVTLLFPTSWATGLAKLIQVLMAVAGMALWLRRAGTVWAAGLVAGLIYIGTGFSAAWGDWAGQASVAALMPGLFWLVERHVQLRSLRSALPISLVVAFLLFGGFPAAAGHALYAAAAYFVVRLIAERRNSTWRSGLTTLGLGVGAVALGIGLSAIQFLPQVSGLLNTDLSYRDNQFYSYQPFKSFVTVLVPRALNQSGFAGSNIIEAYAYVGVGALFLGGLAVWAPRSTGVARGVVSFSVVALLLAAALAWHHGWWTDWMAQLPVFKDNNSGRLRDLVGLFASALAGIGLNLVMRRDLGRAVRRRLTVAGGVGAVGVVGIFFLIWRHYGAVMDHRTFLVDAALGTATVVVVVALLLAGPRRLPATVGVATVIVLIAVQSSISVAYFWPMSPTQDFYPTNPVIEAAQKQSAGERIATVGAFIGSTASAYDLRTITGHTFQPTPWRQLLTAIDPKAYLGSGRTPTNPTLSLSLTDGSLNNPLLDRLSANTVVAAAGSAIPGAGRLPDGTPSPQRPAPGASNIVVPNHAAVALPIAAGGIRAVEVFSTEALPGGATGVQLTATVTDSAGKVLATGSVRQPAVNRMWYQIPVAGEDLAGQGPLTLSVGVNSGGAQSTAVVLAGTGKIPTVRVIGPIDDGLRETFAGDQGTVWERPAALPRIRWADQAQVIDTPSGRLTALESGTLPADSVVLSEPGPLPSGKGAVLHAVHDSGDNITVDVAAAGAGYLVVADSMQSGWRVSIDGAPARMVDADHAFSGVFVPAGQHRVEFSYRGQGMVAGLFITAVSLVILAALYLWARVRRRSSVRTAENELEPPAVPAAS